MTRRWILLTLLGFFLASTGSPQAGGKLGLTGQKMTLALAQSLGLEAVQGVLVTAVEPSGPAARAGLQVGDIIYALGGVPVSDQAGVAAVLSRKGPDELLQVAYLRASRPASVIVILGSSQGASESAGPPPTRSRTTAEKYETTIGPDASGPVARQPVVRESFPRGRVKNVVNERQATDIKFGVAIVPSMNSADSIEQAMFRLVGQMPEIDQVFTPAGATELFRTLVRLREAGREIDFLVIAGHGAAERPGVSLSRAMNSGVENADVDLAVLRRRLSSYEEAMEAARGNPARRRELLEKVRPVCEELRLLEAVGKSMSPGAEVLLINCGASATPTGRKFVLNLGQVLLGVKGGRIVSSTSDVLASQVRTPAERMSAYLSRGQWPPIDTFYAGGFWVTDIIEPAPTNAEERCRKLHSTPTTLPDSRPSLPGSTNWSGTWSTNLGTVVLNGQGDSYAGRLEGTGRSWGLTAGASGDTLIGTWKGSAVWESGPFELVIGREGKSFTGKWADGREEGWNDWHGTRN